MRRLSTLDWILSTTPGADFAVILHLPKTPSLEALRAGARSARKLHPVTAARIDGRRWERVATPGDGVVAAQSGNPAQEALLFLDRPMAPHVESPIQQFVAEDAFVVTRAHHAAVDGFSLEMWLRHQFRVVAGEEQPVAQAADHPVEWRSARRRVTRSFKRTPALWTRSNRASASKRWLTIELPGALSMDALVEELLRILANWNREHDAASEGMCLWMPVNIRKHGSAGFGNGTSRVRVSLREGVPIHREIRESLRCGEWAVPADPLLMRLPRALSEPILRLYLNRPWADMGSAVFSHITNWNGEDAAFQDVEAIELVGQLHRRLPLAINAVTHHAKTWVTFTYDPARLSVEDVSVLAAKLSGSPLRARS